MMEEGGGEDAGEDETVKHEGSGKARAYCLATRLRIRVAHAICGVKVRAPLTFRSAA